LKNSQFPNEFLLKKRFCCTNSATSSLPNGILITAFYWTSSPLPRNLPKGGALPFMKWSQIQGCQDPPRGHPKAAQGGYLEAVKWLAEEGWGTEEWWAEGEWKDEIILGAALGGSMEILFWTKE
jgi:hypothetical protein